GRGGYDGRFRGPPLDHCLSPSIQPARHASRPEIAGKGSAKPEDRRVSDDCQAAERKKQPWLVGDLRNRSSEKLARRIHSGSCCRGTECPRPSRRCPQSMWPCRRTPKVRRPPI